VPLAGLELWQPVGGAAWTAGGPALGRLDSGSPWVCVAIAAGAARCHRGPRWLLVGTGLRFALLVLVVLLLGLGAATATFAALVVCCPIAIDCRSRERPAGLVHRLDGDDPEAGPVPLCFC